MPDVNKNVMTKPCLDNQLINEIQKADSELTKELGKEKMDLVKVVNQIGRINAMLARLTIETYNTSVSRNTDEMEEIIVKLVGTYKTHNVTWMLHGASFAIEIFAAAAGFGTMGKSLQAGAATLGGVGRGLNSFADLFSQQQMAQRTLLEFIMSENRRWRDNNAQTSQKSAQDVKEALAMAKKAEDEHSGAINSASRM